MKTIKYLEKLLAESVKELAKSKKLKDQRMVDWEKGYFDGLSIAKVELERELREKKSKK